MKVDDLVHYEGDNFESPWVVGLDGRAHRKGEDSRELHGCRVDPTNPDGHLAYYVEPSAASLGPNLRALQEHMASEGLILVYYYREDELRLMSKQSRESVVLRIFTEETSELRLSISCDASWERKPGIDVCYSEVHVDGKPFQALEYAHTALVIGKPVVEGPCDERPRLPHTQY